jgi:ferric-dicitrate binding protein FerR (iron transport regulator)
MPEFEQPVRYSRRHALKVVVLAGAGLVTGIAGAAAAAVVGAIAELRGEAVAQAGGERRKLKVKSPVAIGDTLATGEDSRLKAALKGKTVLRLGSQTKVTIDKFIANSGGELVLGDGALLLDAPSGKFRKGLTIESPFALIAVRGTRVFAGPIDGTFGVFVSKGAVDVSAGGKKVSLKAGEGTDIARASDPPGPVKAWKKPKIDKATALVM